MQSESPVMLITGASSGIGLATARLFSQQGYRLVLAARRMERLLSLTDEIQQSGGQALPVQADVSRLDQVQSLVQQALERFGQIDVLLNNAGIGRLDWLERLDAVEEIEPQLQVNLWGAIQMTRAILPHMIARRSGHIILMNSLAGLIAPPTYSVYAASKYGLRGFTEALRREVGVWGIHVTGIYPGAVDTEFTEHAGIHRRTGVTTPRLLRLSAQQVAQAVFRTVQRPSKSIFLPTVMRPVVWLNACLPGVLDWAMERWFVRREREL